jgi:hypothetical protein
MEPYRQSAGLWNEHSLGCCVADGWSWTISRKVQTSETFIEVAMIRLLVARLGRRS